MNCINIEGRLKFIQEKISFNMEYNKSVQTKGSVLRMKRN